MKTTLGIAMVLLFSSLAACGGGGGSAPLPDYAGVYVVDVDRTLAAESPTPAARARYEASFGPSAWKLELLGDNTFTLNMAHGGGQAFVVKGTWEAAADSVTLRAAEAGGAAIPDGERQDDALPYDGEVLKLAKDGREIVLKRL